MNDGQHIQPSAYGDFQCPACKSYFPVLQTLSEEFDGTKVAFAFRQFPLRRIHSNAESAARASEAAGLQGAFWEMHDLLFERQSVWENKRNPKETFFVYAEELKLDMARFENDFESNAVKQAVEDDFSQGIQSGVNSTPTFFLNGAHIPNPSSYDEFKSIIEQALGTIPSS